MKTIFSTFGQRARIETAALAIACAISAGAADYEWNFANGNLSPAVGNGVMSYADSATPGLTSFAVSDGAAVPHINGQPAAYMNVPAFTDSANGYHVTFTDSGPNGGGAYINEYTFIFDLFVPGAPNWTPLFNADPNNGNDADFYVDPTGRLGIGAIGYSSAGTVAPDTWYRVAFAADLGNTAAYYVNGNNVFSGAGPAIDGRFSLYSNLDDPPATDVLLFNEGDGGGVYTHDIYVSSVFFTDRTLSASEIMALGGPNAAGIMVPEPGTVTLLGLGLALTALCARRRRG